jgi:hypothetical protein
MLDRRTPSARLIPRSAITEAKLFGMRADARLGNGEERGEGRHEESSREDMIDGFNAAEVRQTFIFLAQFFRGS